MHVLVRAYMHMYICVHNYVYLLHCTAGPIDQHVGEISSYLLWPTVFHSPFESFPRSQLQFKQVVMATTMAGYKEEAALSMHTEANTYPS